MNHPWKALIASQRTQDEREEGTAAAAGSMWMEVPLPPLRFFLRSPVEIWQVYLPPDGSFKPHML